MKLPDKLKNPFYVLLMVAGVAFVVTASGYFVMTLRLAKPGEPRSEASREFENFMDAHGATLLMVELAVLAASTVAAIATDGFWMRLAARGNGGSSPASPAESDGTARDQAGRQAGKNSSPS